MDSLQQLIQHNTLLYHIIVALIIVAAFSLLSGVAKRFLGWAAKKIFARTETTLDDLIVDVIRTNVRSLMILIGLHIGVREIRKACGPADVTANQILDYADAILYVVVVVVLLKIVLGSVRVLINWYLDELAVDDGSHLKMTLAPLTSKIINLVIGLIAIIILLDHFGINIGSLLVSLGVGSLAVALAAQDTLANMIAGFVIMIDRPFRVGDRIELPTGQVGDVHKIGLRSTGIMNFDNNLIIIPNAELAKGRIVNYSFPNDQMRVLLRFDLALGTDTGKARGLLLQLTEEHPDVLRDPPPQVFVTSLSESGVQCTLVGRCSDYLKQFEIETGLREKVHERFMREGILFGVPQRIVRMKQES